MFEWLLTDETDAGPYIAGRILRHFQSGLDEYYDVLAPLARQRDDEGLAFQFRMWERERIRKANMER